MKYCLWKKKINVVVAMSARLSRLPIHVIMYMKLPLVGNNSQLREFVYNKPLGLCCIRLDQINFLHSNSFHIISECFLNEMPVNRSGSLREMRKYEYKCQTAFLGKETFLFVNDQLKSGRMKS